MKCPACEHHWSPEQVEKRRQEAERQREDERDSADVAWGVALLDAIREGDALLVGRILRGHHAP